MSKRNKRNKKKFKQQENECQYPAVNTSISSQSQDKNEWLLSRLMSIEEFEKEVLSVDPYLYYQFKRNEFDQPDYSQLVHTNSSLAQRIKKKIKSLTKSGRDILYCKKSRTKNRDIIDNIKADLVGGSTHDIESHQDPSINDFARNSVFDLDNFEYFEPFERQRSIQTDRNMKTLEEAIRKYFMSTSMCKTILFKIQFSNIV